MWGDLAPGLRPGVLEIDGRLDLRDLLPLLVHGIRIQRNVLTHVSPEGVPVHIAIEVVPVAVSLEAPAVAGHPFDKFGNFSGDLIRPRRFAGEQRWRECLGTGPPRNRMKEALARFRRAHTEPPSAEGSEEKADQASSENPEELSPLRLLHRSLMPNHRSPSQAG